MNEMRSISDRIWRISRTPIIGWRWFRTPRLVFRKYKVAPRLGTWAVRRRLFGETCPTAAPFLPTFRTQGLTGRQDIEFERFSFLLIRFKLRSKLQ